jgi:class 3 adenylate cyclase
MPQVAIPYPDVDISSPREITVSSTTASNANGTSRRVVESLLGEAMARGERTAAGLRCGVTALALTHFLLAGGALELMHPTSRAWIVFGVLALAGLASLKLVLGDQAQSVGETRILKSVAIDAFIVIVCTYATSWWVTPESDALLSLPTFAFFLLAIFAAGLRISVHAVVLGSVLNSFGLLAVITVDHLRTGALTHQGFHGTFMAPALLLGAAILTFAITHRTRGLVFQGAKAAVVAERTRQRLDLYVSQEVAEEAMQTDSIRLTGTRRPMAVLFCDLRGFTQYSEMVEPEALMRELNAYLDAMVTEIQAEGGVIDKYLGDGLLAVFGMTGSREDDALRALRAAHGMQAALRSHNEARRAWQLPPLQHGIGVHYGEAVAGNVGTAQRLQYTVMGDTVNIASRLEQATKGEPVSVLFSEALVDAARRAARTLSFPALRLHADLSLPGRPAPIAAWTFRR